MSKKTLVIGASEKRNRYSNLAIHKLLKTIMKSLLLVQEMLKLMEF